MAKPRPRPDTDAVTDLSRQTLAALRLNPFAGPHTRRFWEVQELLLDEVEGFSRRWFARRHAAARTALGASAQAIGPDGAEPSAVVTALTAWQAQSAARVAEDMQDWIGLFGRCACHLTGGEAAACRDMLERASADIAVVRTDHADPV